MSSLTGDAAKLLRDRSSFFQQGLQADAETVRRYAGFASFDTTGYAVKRLGDQIALLRELFPTEQSPYMAYRLGVLTGLIMDLNSPFATATDPRSLKLRDRFMKDVEAHLAELRYEPRPPRVIRRPDSYVKAAIERSAGWVGPVRSQYLSGKGYNFIVQRAVSKFFNGAVQSVADVLYTIGSGRGETAAAGRYEFDSDACSFYLSRGMKGEALEAYRKVGDAALSLKAGKIDSLEAAVDRYDLILQVASLKDSMEASGVEVRERVGEKLMEPFLLELSRLAKKYMDSGQGDKARVALEICLREKYLPEWVLKSLKKLYGLDKLKDLDVAENAWKIYLEANGFESMAGRAYTAGRLWAANDYFARAAALYSAIPGSARDLRKASRSRIDQIIGRMRTIPAAALLSEELFQAGVDSMAEEDVEAAVRGLQMSRHWGPEDGAVGGAIADAQSLQLFLKGRDFYQDGEYEKGVKYFRKLTSRFPRSPFAGPAKKMIDIFDKRKAMDAGRLLLLLKGAYEASFVGDKDSVFGLCDEILETGPSSDFRDRAHLLIVVAWYQSNQKGYLKIERVFRKLMRHRVLKEDGGKLILRKRIDFYFGLKDPFPEIDLSKLDDKILSKLDLGEEAAPPADAEEAAGEAIEKAADEIEAVEDMISRGEGEGRDMDDTRSLLDEAGDRLGDARDRFDEGVYDEAEEFAADALEKAFAAREKAEEVMEVAEGLSKDAEETIDRAESVIEEAEADLNDVEDKTDTEYGSLRADLDEAKDLLNDAKSLLSDGDYDGAIEKATEAIDKADELQDNVEDLQAELL